MKVNYSITRNIIIFINIQSFYHELHQSGIVCFRKIGGYDGYGFYLAVGDGDADVEVFELGVGLGDGGGDGAGGAHSSKKLSSLQ